MPRYIDSHNHILFGIDDGARNIREAMLMADEAWADGVRVIIATSHIHPGAWEFDYEG